MPDPLFQLKQLFFDRDVVIKAMDRASRGALSKAGAYIRTRARSSMRKRRKASPPGKPPSVHEGSLKRLLFFSWDPRSKSVVVGPVKFRAGTAPRLLEFGGKTTIKFKGETVTATYKPRPYMGPALKAELAAGTIPKQFSGSLASKW